jgi:LacI family transcriptional regulator/LacI family purine nucleotide synthesis repressor
MSVTIIDVAREAGVSKSTVSLVMNGNTAIKKQTRERVLKTIQKMGYIPNINARNLTTRKNHILGVAMNVENFAFSSYDFDLETEIFSYDVCRGIQARLENFGYGVLQERFCVTDKDALPKFVINKRVDGVFILGSAFYNQLIIKLKKEKIIFVVVGRHVSEADSVSPDFIKAAYISTEYLITKGHKKILFINCPTLFSSNQDRLTGINQAVSEYGYSMNPKWIINTQHNTGKGAYEVIKYCWENGVRPDGIFMANDTLALGVMRFLYEQHVRVPEDVSIIGYEDSILAGYAVPPLTTINISKPKMGEQAAQLMLERIRNPRKKFATLVVDPILVERSSVIRRQ